MAKEQETRTYKLTAEPEILNRIERLLALMYICGTWGASRTFQLSFDGDGADRIQVSKSTIRPYIKGAGAIISPGDGLISVNGPGFLGLRDGIDQKPKRRFGDDGSKIEIEKDYKL